MIKRILYLYVLLLSRIFLIAASMDLDSISQDFVIEVKKIEIPGFPDAFNPSIIPWNKGILMSFRFRDPLTTITDPIGLVILDEELKVREGPFVLNRRTRSIIDKSTTQDPRLTLVNGVPFVAFSKKFFLESVLYNRMAVAPLEHNACEFFIDEPPLIEDFDIAVKKNVEKNWVPIGVEDRLLLGYSINPHHLLNFDTDSASWKTVAYTEASINWPWGELRGGTPAVKIGEEYLSIFHSSIVMKTKQSQDKKIAHYFMGAYTFSSQPPFQLTGVSAKPIVHRTFYNGPMHNTWKPLRCVFPCGIMIHNDQVWVSYGRQDHECWIAKIDVNLLLKSLKIL